MIMRKDLWEQGVFHFKFPGGICILLSMYNKGSFLWSFLNLNMCYTSLLAKLTLAWVYISLWSNWCFGRLCTRSTVNYMVCMKFILLHATSYYQFKPSPLSFYQIHRFLGEKWDQIWTVRPFHFRRSWYFSELEHERNKAIVLGEGLGHLGWLGLRDWNRQISYECPH